IDTPFAFIGTAKCSTVCASPGSSHTALVTSKSPIGEPLEKILRALIRYPPSVFVAVPALFSQSEPPLDTRIKSSASTRLKTPSVGAFRCRQRQDAAATRCECIEKASAVAPQLVAIPRTEWQISA